ncbi:molybdopterin-dependent oxidoreductase [Pseudomonas aeruginosa]|nr:molybdopterin-dependent oxidoreductase [Pseudomonas aeruginosa]
MPADKVRVCAAYVGGAFGSGLRPQYQLALAVMAALQLRRSVRVVLTRQQMFTFGYRPRTLQRLQLGADAEGRLACAGPPGDSADLALRRLHRARGGVERHALSLREPSLAYRLVPLDLYTPLDMRAPGAALGLIGLECAMDELAVRLGMDPIALRRFNFAERNGNEDKPYPQGAAGLLRGGRPALRLAGPRPTATEHERRAPVARLGHGRRRLGRPCRARPARGRGWRRTACCGWPARPRISAPAPTR